MTFKWIFEWFFIFELTVPLKIGGNCSSILLDSCRHFNALCKLFFERLPAYSGEYSHTILRLIFVVERKGRPLIPPSELMSLCAYKKELCFLASLILSFFPSLLYFFYYSFRNPSWRSCGRVVSAWAGSCCFLIPFPKILSSVQNGVQKKKYCLLSVL